MYLAQTHMCVHYIIILNCSSYIFYYWSLSQRINGQSEPITLNEEIRFIIINNIGHQ